ncbi:ATP-binding cassette domain-containing protein [Actinomadura sp. LD22]|uniref:ATP-binding cassette domain-containing protein n=1 Tax=Actinomadura physcomitrii TaxID=2650748 RepID=A0A6I4MBJ2_9ACTN|nr:ATP-binding cassette domain-containing protein [Actinomadura physcomitrii]MWA03618.1 ATP-binding cassette domain-containing protein [Actinomadura physcomitrii]
MTSTAVKPLLDVRDVSITYPRRKTPAVDDVSLSIGSGEIVAVVGESGSGKSTLARAVVGLLRPDRGSISHDGTVLAGRRTTAQRRDIQMVFQDPRSSLNPRLTVRKIVAEGWRTHPSARPADPEAGLVQLMDRVGLPAGLLDRTAEQLSGGQAQRVSIARAISIGPRLLVCDEAVSALDVSVQTQILSLLLRLRDELGLALLFITHDLGVVRQIADRVVVMHSARVVEQGPADDIFERPRDSYTRALLDSVLDLAAPPTYEDPA